MDLLFAGMVCVSKNISISKLYRLTHRESILISSVTVGCGFLGTVVRFENGRGVFFNDADLRSASIDPFLDYNLRSCKII